MLSSIRSERESIQKDALSSAGKTLQERVAMFIDLMEIVEAILAHLPPEERARRLNIARQLDPLPNPGWRNFREEALAEFNAKPS